MAGSMWSTFWKMVAVVVQHAADRELFVAGELAAANGLHKKLGVYRDRNVRLGSKAVIPQCRADVRFTPRKRTSFQRGFDIRFGPEIKHGGGKRGAICEYDCEGGRSERLREDTF
jgi:hypothetical protein